MLAQNNHRPEHHSFQAAQAWALALLGLLVCAGCAAGGRLERAVSPGQLSARGPLPAPAALLPAAKPHSAAYVESDLQQTGAQYNGTLPNNRVAASADACVFTPADAGPGALSDAAYALYSFSIAGYDRNPQVRLIWSAAPPAGKLWLGLGKWGANRWDWFSASPSAPCNFATLAPYIRGDGALLLAVVCLGMAPATLDTLRIGSEPPTAALSITPQTAFAPFQAALDASASSDPDGSIAKYEWDLDGDGVFELDTDANPSPPAQSYAAAGAFPVALRVTDNDGLQATAQAQVTALSAWLHSWGGGGFESLFASAYDGHDGLYFGGHTTSFGVGDSDGLLLKFNLAGELQWVRTWGTAGYDSVVDLAFDASGNLVALLQSGTGFIAPAVQHWSPAGVFLDSTYLTYGNDMYPRALATAGADSYVVGEMYVGLEPNAYIAKLDASNTLAWLKCWDPGNSGLSAAAVHQGIAFGSMRIYAAGHSGGQVLLLSCDSDGGSLSASVLTTPGNAYATALSITGFAKLSIWIAGAQNPTSGNTNALLAQYISGSPIANGWCGSASTYATGLVRAPGGGFDLVGNIGTGAAPQGMALGFSAGGALNDSAALTGSGPPYPLSGRCASLYGAGLQACGYCAAAGGAGWGATSGTITSITASWSDAAMSEVAPGAVASAGLPGTVGTPTGGVLDSGARNSDALAVVRPML